MHLFIPRKFNVSFEMRLTKKALQYFNYNSKSLQISNQIKCWFLERGENWSTRRKTSWSRIENQQQTQPTYDTESGNRTRDTYIGGLELERSHHCVLL